MSVATTREPRLVGSPARRLPLLDRYSRERDPADLDALLDAFEPLARSLARRYTRPNEPVEELLQIANIGLWKALTRYDPDRANGFASFAVPTILGELRRFRRDSSWAVRVPRRLQEQILEVTAASDAWSAQHGRAPSPGELSRVTQLPEEEVLEALVAASSVRLVALDARVDDGQGEDTQLDRLGNLDDGYRHVDERDQVLKTLMALPASQRDLLRMRFNEELTQTQIARRIGCSQMHVSRLLRSALDALARAGASSAPAVPS